MLIHAHYAGRAPHAASDVFDNLERREPDGSSSKGPTSTASDEQPLYRPWWEAEASQSSGPASNALSARISSSEQASTSQPAGDWHGHQPVQPDAPRSNRTGGNAQPTRQPASSQVSAAQGTLSAEPQASPSTDTAGAELQASSWEPWYDRQQSEGWDDWGSPQRPSEPRWEPSEPRWEPPAQGQPSDDAAGSSRGPADQAAAQVRCQNFARAGVPETPAPGPQDLVMTSSALLMPHRLAMCMCCCHARPLWGCLVPCWPCSDTSADAVATIFPT